MKNASTRADAQLREFVRKDLGKDLESSGSGLVIRPQRMTAIRLGADLIAQLREAGKQYGVPYQTMLKIIARRHVAEYLKPPRGRPKGR
jgi:uncharacterized protein (DUF4415 family)